MDQFTLFLTSFGCGVTVAAPVGPMALLCMRRTLVRGWVHGIATSAGIATADGIYALVAALGLASVSTFVTAHEQVLHAAAGLFLVYLGLSSLRAKPEEAVAPDSDGTKAARIVASWPAAYASAVLLTLTNPPTIILFAALFAGLAPRSGFEATTALLTVAGVSSGSLIWWCGLTAAVATFRHAIGVRARRWIDRAAGVFFLIFGGIELKRALS